MTVATIQPTTTTPQAEFRLQQRRRPNPQVYLVPLVDGSEVTNPASGLRRTPATPGAPDGNGQPTLTATWTATAADHNVQVFAAGYADGPDGPLRPRAATFRAVTLLTGDQLAVTIPAL